MGFLKSYTYTVCISLMAITVFSVLVPSGNIKRIVKAVLSVMIMLAFILPLRDVHISKNIFDFDIISEQASDTEEEALEIIICENIKNKLIEADYNNCGVTVKIKRNSDETQIKSVNITITDKYNADEIRSYIFNELGLNAEVNYIGE